MEKFCNKCKVHKNIEFFYNDKTKEDGKRTICKQCSNFYKKQHRRTEKGKLYRKIEAERRKKTGKKKISNEKWNSKNKDKMHAHYRIRYAIVKGNIIRPSFCSICFVTCKPEAHHDDYKKPLDVIWVCKDCHEKIHMTMNRSK